MDMSTNIINVDNDELAIFKEALGSRYALCEQSPVFFKELTLDNIYVMENGVERPAEIEDLECGKNAELIIRGTLSDGTDCVMHQTRPVSYMNVNGQLIVEGVDWVASGFDFKSQYEMVRSDFGQDEIVIAEDMELNQPDLIEIDGGYDDVPCTFWDPIETDHTIIDDEECPEYDNFGNPDVDIYGNLEDDDIEYDRDY
jgi:hypothetical protein